MQQIRNCPYKAQTATTGTWPPLVASQYCPWKVNRISLRPVSSNISNCLTALLFFFSALDKSCGGTLNATTGGYVTDVDNDHDRNYDHNLNCVWLIIAMEKKHIFLKFDYFEMESSENCKNDYLKVSE